jgi:serine/threonine protein kinase
MEPAKLEADAIFQVARRIPPGEGRILYLDQACGEETGLRNRLEAMLRVHDEDHGFLAAPAEGVPQSPTDRITEGPGTRIGPYKLLEVIGEGGFGKVFMAEQDRPVSRKVALKIVKPGMDTREVIARFESERQALALLNHPNIAQIFDGGETESGRPYFVMELVKGAPITEFCDKNHLPADERLRLFISVCHAIQHAHYKGVIHRDIKPSNVMITLHDGVPVVKVIDFGVAKATAQKLTEKTLFTSYGQMIGTPTYMSPEQAEMSGLDVDTRTDIYSLGVLLYELLTGTTPLDAVRLREAGFAEMQRLIREVEPPKPSTRLSSLGDSATILAGNRASDPKHLARLLAGDLDWIVMNSLEKDRNRRYASPGTFAEDIDRFLRREAIVARPPSAIYRLRKFAQRHRTTVYAMVAIVVALCIGTAFAVWQAVVATHAKEEAYKAAEAESAEKNRANAKEAETRAILDFVENRILLAPGPKGRQGGLGPDANRVSRTNRSPKPVCEWYWVKRYVTRATAKRRPSSTRRPGQFTCECWVPNTATR